MSEFAYSLHLFGATVDDAVQQLRSAQLPGAVLGSGPSATTVLMETDHVEAFLAASHHPVLIYSYAADYGLWLWFHDKGDLIARIEYAWLGEEEMEEKPQITPDVGNVLVQHELIAPEQGAQLQKGVAAMSAAVARQQWESIFAGIDPIGKALGLYAFRRLSAEDIVHNREELQERYPDMEIVDSR